MVAVVSATSHVYLENCVRVALFGSTHNNGWKCLLIMRYDQLACAVHRIVVNYDKKNVLEIIFQTFPLFCAGKITMNACKKDMLIVYF